MRREVSCRYKEMANAQTGAQIGSVAVTTFLESMVKIQTLVETLIDKRQNALIEHHKNGGSLEEIQIPRECLEEVLARCAHGDENGEYRIPVQVAGRDNLCDSPNVTLIYRGAKDYLRDDFGDFVLDENGKQIGTGGDKEKLLKIVDEVMEKYINARKMSAREINQEWEGVNTVEVSGLNLRQAELYQAEALSYDIESFMRYYPETRTYSIEIKTSDIERENIDIPSKGEKWLTACTMLQSYPEVDAYIREQGENDLIISDCIEKARSGKEYESQTVFCLGNYSQIDMNMRSHITLDGNLAKYSYFECDADGQLINAMDVKTFDLTNETEFEEFEKQWASIGPHAVVSTESYNKTIIDPDYTKTLDIRACSIYDQYINNIGEFKDTVLEITKDNENCLEFIQNENSKEKQWTAREMRIPNSDKVVEFMLNTTKINSEVLDEQININLQQARAGLKITPSSQFVSCPSYMLKENSAITYENHEQVVDIDSPSKTAAEHTVGVMAGDADNIEYNDFVDIVEQSDALLENAEISAPYWGADETDDIEPGLFDDN